MKRRLALLCLCLSAVLILTAVFASVRFHAAIPFRPAYEREDLTRILEKEMPDESDYKTLFFQTGLGRSAVDDLWKRDDRIALFSRFQEDFFRAPDVKCFPMAITTGMDLYTDETGDPVYGFSLAPYQAGDVFACESTHSLGWRHGHAGLVVGHNRTLEAAMIGTDSEISSANAWRCYSTFILLRYTKADADTRSQLAQNAARSLTDIPYNLLALSKSGTRPGSTQCAHLVWFAYHNAGFDIDCNGGLFVTVQNLIDNPDFEVVQIFGFDPARFWRD